MTIQDIFKIPIYKTKLDLDSKKIQSYCIEHLQKDKGINLSNVGGYHSHDLPLNDISLQPLIKEIETHSNKFAKAFLNNNKQVMTNIWFNINQYKDSNQAHNHAGMDIAGVYYVKTPSECGHIIFEHPLAHSFGYYYYNMCTGDQRDLTEQHFNDEEYNLNT